MTSPLISLTNRTQNIGVARARSPASNLTSKPTAGTAPAHPSRDRQGADSALTKET
jgi:hypothetical protein